ncbi:MAG: hypothetical protein ACRCS6_09860 [Turicibacter sp.]
MEYKPLNWLPSWEEILDKPLTYAPSTHTHAISEVNNLQGALDGKLGKTEKAVDSDKLDGIDSLGFFKSTANHANNLDNFQNNSAYWFTPSVANSPTSYGIVLNVNSDQTWRNQLAFGTDAQIYFRQKINDEAWRNWVTLWHSGNSNKRDVDWTARYIRSYGGSIRAQFSDNDNAINIQSTINNIQGENAAGNTPKHITLQKFGGFVGINVPYPDLHLAIGDTDTGFNWLGDGHLSAYANSARCFHWTSGGFYLDKDLNSEMSGIFKGNVVADSVGVGNCFHRPAIAGYGWGSGNGALTVDIRNNANQTPLLLARREGSSERLFSLELLNTGGHLHFVQRGNNMIRLVNGSNIYLDKNTTCEGNLLVKGETTGYTLDSIVFDEPTTRSTTNYQSDQQQEALYLMSSEIQQLRTENADLKKRLDALEGIILNNKQ